jgi:sensor domain CHASE-containing protein
MSKLFGTVRAFFSGFTALTRQFASSRVRQHRIRLVAGLMAATYYAVQAYYFLHHSAVAPREKVSDAMGLMFQCVLAPVFFMGFQWLVGFILREDVQAFYARVVTAIRKRALWAWWTGSVVVRWAVVASVTSVQIGLLLCGATVGFVRWSSGVFARGLVRQLGHLRAFARTCVETGQNAR